MKHDSNIDRFRQEDAGALLVLWAVSIAVILGIVALSFDFGRLASTQSELQSYADHVALAAAGELDGENDAIIRATAAAANLISDTQAFGSGAKNLTGPTNYTLDFYDTLPASDQAAIAAGLTTDPNDAIYARVVAVPQTVNFTFGAAFFALTGNAPSNNQVSAIAIAGFTQYACDVTPLMFCLPSPTFTAAGHVGELILLRSGGGGTSAWGPGDFGFLDPAKINVSPNGPCAGLNGVKLDACLIGAEGSITQCFVQRGVDTEPGQKVGIEDAIFNVRFDIYKSIMNGKKNDTDYPPAPNVIKGIVPNNGGGGGPQCVGGNPQPSSDTLGMPRDDCFGSLGCSRFGDGDWLTGRAAYVAANYGGIDPHPTANSRYEYYKDEITAAGGGGSSQSILTGLSETGRPQCSNNQSIDPDRRVVIAAGIDCNANPVVGQTNNVPVKEFYRLFLTEPVGNDGSSPPTLDLWVEIVGSAGGPGAGTGGTGGIFRDVVQLYR
ncbi:MAG: Tad domain-containing protein [Marinosulfonomonas sp.]|nr:Tad domain-containing protein [Marinosulfonomonas sp.]